MMTCSTLQVDCSETLPQMFQEITAELGLDSLTLRDKFMVQIFMNFREICEHAHGHAADLTKPPFHLAEKTAVWCVNEKQVTQLSCCDDMQHECWISSVSY